VRYTEGRRDTGYHNPDAEDHEILMPLPVGKPANQPLPQRFFWSPYGLVGLYRSHVRDFRPSQAMPEG
jgi:hypothetical protein